MNALSFSFWRDPHRRELIVAAAAGAIWALVGVAIASSEPSLAPSLPAPSPWRGGLGRGEAAGTSADVAYVTPCTHFLTSPPSPLRQGEGSGQTKASSCRIHNSLPGGVANVGSGTLVDVTADRTRGLILSCAHLFTEGQGRIVIEFPGGRTHGANLIAIDRNADLSALEIAEPHIAPASIASTLDRAATLTACGFGPSGAYRCVAGRIVGTSASSGQENLQIAGGVRSGDSGGGVFDPSGRLVGVVWGEAGGVTYASTGRPLSQFLQRVLGSRRGTHVAEVVRPPSAAEWTQSPNCPTGVCPLVRPLAPASIGVAPAGRSPAAGGGLSTASGATPVACPCNCNGACGSQLAAIASRLDALDTTKQDRGDYVDAAALKPLARADQLAMIDRESRQRESALVERLESRLEALAPLVGAAGRAALPVVLPALGISGPLGWGVLAAASIGSALIASRLHRRGVERGSRSEPRTDSSSLTPSSSSLAPPEAPAAADGSFRAGRLTAETHAPIERDDREARELLRLSQLEGRDPLQDALAGRLALDRLDAVAEGDADPQRARLADDLRRELRERFNEIAPTRFEVPQALSS